MKVEQRREARRLRTTEGLPIREIAERLAVSKSSVSLWVRDIALTPEQEAALAARNPALNGQMTGMRVRRERCRLRRVEAQAHGRRLAEQGDPVHRGGCMLFWGEGSKQRNVVQIANTDADLLETFLDFLRRCYAVPDSAYSFSVNCFLGNGLTLREIESWWLARLGLPASCLRKAIVNRASSASRRRRGNVHPYGTARLTLHSTEVMQSIYGAIQEYAGIDRPEWLDL